MSPGRTRYSTHPWGTIPQATAAITGTALGVGIAVGLLVGQFVWLSGPFAPGILVAVGVDVVTLVGADVVAVGARTVGGIGVSLRTKAT